MGCLQMWEKSVEYGCRRKLLWRILNVGSDKIDPWSLCHPCLGRSYCVGHRVAFKGLVRFFRPRKHTNTHQSPSKRPGNVVCALAAAKAPAKMISVFPTWFYRTDWATCDFRQVFTYPMEMYVARHVLDVSVFQTMLGKGPITQARHYGLTLGLWTLSIIVSMSTNDLGSILEIFGAFGASVSVPGLAMLLRIMPLDDCKKELPPRPAT